MQSQSGNEWVVNIDREKFFDRVNHNKLMARVMCEVKDKGVLKIKRDNLNRGVMATVVMETEEGTPKGGPLSPLLSNIMLEGRFLDPNMNHSNAIHEEQKCCSS